MIIAGENWKKHISRSVDMQYGKMHDSQLSWALKPRVTEPKRAGIFLGLDNSAF